MTSIETVQELKFNYNQLLKDSKHLSSNLIQNNIILLGVRVSSQCSTRSKIMMKWPPPANKNADSQYTYVPTAPSILPCILEKLERFELGRTPSSYPFKLFLSVVEVEVLSVVGFLGYKPKIECRYRTQIVSSSFLAIDNLAQLKNTR